MPDMEESSQIQQLNQRCIDRAYPPPIIFQCEYDYPKARCPVCDYETLLRGYQMHITRAHRPNNYKSRKGIKYKPYDTPKRRAAEIVDDQVEQQKS
jgi:hypothetical protein